VCAAVCVAACATVCVAACVHIRLPPYRHVRERRYAGSLLGVCLVVYVAVCVAV